MTGDQKIALLATFIGFLEEYLGEAEAEAGVKHEQGVEIFAADQKAWEEFKTKVSEFIREPSDKLNVYIVFPGSPTVYEDQYRYG